MHDNDKTIFNYLNPTDNIKFSQLDIQDMLTYLDKYYLEYRQNIGLDSFSTFGIEIEMEHFVGWRDFSLTKFQLELYKLIGNKKWDARNDLTLEDGREIVSEILTDTSTNWDNIRKACELSSINGKIDVNCSLHVHAGAQILGENAVYWYRLFRLWQAYENVIYRFCYGEYLSNRPNILIHAKPVAMFYEERLALVKDMINSCSLIEMLRKIEPRIINDDRYTKRFGVSYWRMLADNDFDEYEDFNKINDGCTFELRCPNGTFDEIIIQNHVNFFIKFMLYCRSDRFDEDILNRRKLLVSGMLGNLDAYSQIYLDQAIELCDMIFENNIDKIYFLRQYIKSFEIADKPFARARKFTATSRG